MHKLKRFVWRWQPHHLANLDRIASVLVVCLLAVGQASAVDYIRFGDRSLKINDSTPGITTEYTVSFKYTTTASVGSIDLLFCYDPIPYHPCVAPTGLNVSNAALTSQSGETGFGITTRTSNRLVLSRTPAVTGSDQSTYVLSGIVNPTDTTQAFSIRMADYASTDASGTFINMASVRSQVTNVVQLETQVPPILIFCMAGQVNPSCSETNEEYYTDMGEFDPTKTLAAQSQMAVGTNASGGFVITVNGTPMAAGNNQLNPLPTPTPSAPGNNQFGINLVANSVPLVGANPDDPEAAWTNAVAAPGYDQPNRYMYKDGDVIASSPNVSLVRRFTVSYIANARPDLPAGVYTTTLTYIASGRF